MVSIKHGHCPLIHGLYLFSSTYWTHCRDQYVTKTWTHHVSKGSDHIYIRTFLKCREAKLDLLVMGRLVCHFQVIKIMTPDQIKISETEFREIKVLKGYPI